MPIVGIDSTFVTAAATAAGTHSISTAKHPACSSSCKGHHSVQALACPSCVIGQRMLRCTDSDACQKPLSYISHAHFGCLHQLGGSLSFLSLGSEASNGTNTLWSQANMAHARNTRPNNGFYCLHTGWTATCTASIMYHHQFVVFLCRQGISPTCVHGTMHCVCRVALQCADSFWQCCLTHLRL